MAVPRLQQSPRLGQLAWVQMVSSPSVLRLVRMLDVTPSDAAIVPFGKSAFGLHGLGFL